MKIALASDHRGFELKEKLTKELSKNYEILDLGTDSIDQVDFPKYGILLGETIAKKEADLGIAICGTGIGISIAANKVKGVMCAKINNIKEAQLAKMHNRANIIAISGNTSKRKALKMINEFISQKPLKDEKYVRRINQIKDYENER